MKFKIKKSNRDFPIYVSQIINLANSNSKATSATVCGFSVVSEFDSFKSCSENFTQAEWSNWLNSRHP